MFIKRAKSRPSIRARDTDDEATTSGSPLAKSVVSSSDPQPGTPSSMDQDEESGSVMQRKKAQSKEKKGKGSRLSFGGDNEETSSTPFKPKKSLLSQSIKLPSTPTSDSHSTSNSPAGPSGSSIYSQEYLSQLKASTPSKAPRVEDEEDEDMDGSMDNGNRNGTSTSYGTNGGLSSMARDKYAANIKEDTTAGIPDDAAIAAARMKRQAAINTAKRGVESEDYIALGGGQIAVWDGEKGPHPESRLMREEDEGEEGDEELADYTESNDRLFLGNQANKSAARRLKGEIGELIDDREMEDEDDEETREWEEAQVRRGGTWEPEKPIAQPIKAYTPALIPVARPLPTISSASARIAHAIKEIKSTQVQAEHNLEVAVRDLAILEEQEKDLRVEVERVEGKREWAEGFRQWVDLLGGFLEEKMPKLENIEGDAVHHLKERAEMTNKRRRADDEDDLTLFLGTPLPVPADASVDDLGRTTSAEAGPSSAVGRARRSERNTRRSKRQERKVKQEDEEGFSTDSTLAEGDAEDYEDAHRDLGKRVRSLLDDVRAEDFRDPEKGLAVKFGDWRRRYEDEYVGAFGGLSMVQAWEFYARGEMIGWEPLRASKALESFDWFHALHAYSRPKVDRPAAQNGDDDDDMDLDDEPPLGPDGDLVIEMVQKAVVPLLTKHFEADAYDPYSAPQTRRAIDLVEVVADLTGKESKKYTALLKAIMAVFNDHIVSLATLVGAAMAGSAPPLGMKQEGQIAMSRFLRKRVKLLRNILLWRREAPAEARELVNRLVAEVVRPILERQWEAGGRELGVLFANTAGTELRPDLAVFLREGPGHRRAW